MTAIEIIGWAFAIPLAITSAVFTVAILVALGRAAFNKLDK